MFSAGSRYLKAGTYVVTGPRGEPVTVTRLPVPRSEPLAGSHQRLDSQRLDLIAFHFFRDATAFWRLCDANGVISPDALAVSRLVAIPRTEG